MAELTQEQFRIAVADAAAAVINVYREVDAMFRELGVALGEGDPGFKTLVKRLVPGANRKNPDARYLRNYVAWVFAPIAAEQEEDEDDEEGEGEDEEEEDAPKQKRAILLPVGSGIVLARAAIYDRGATVGAAFEPHLMIAVLKNCRVDVPTDPGAEVRVPRSRFKTILSALGRHTEPPGKPFLTGVPVQLEGQGKGKAKYRLVFDLPHAARRYPLFDVTPGKIAELAGATRAIWTGAAVA